MDLKHDYGFVLIIAIIILIILSLPIIFIYKKYLKYNNKWYSLLLVFYPFIVYKLGVLISDYGTRLNIEDKGAKIHIAKESIDYIGMGGPGYDFIFWGFYIYFVAILPISLLIAFFILRRLIRH